MEIMELHRIYMELHRNSLWSFMENFIGLHRNSMELHMSIFYGEFLWKFQWNFSVALIYIYDNFAVLYKRENKVCIILGKKNKQYKETELKTKYRDKTDRKGRECNVRKWESEKKGNE
jgi:hypothetical protein